jgi:hypothetical protein
MSTVFSDLGVSADGFAAGLNQREEAPFGDIDENWLHAWMFETYDENREEVDAIVDSGATIMGRNMFGPVRGEWDRDWRGWWAEPAVSRARLRAHPLRAPVHRDGGRHHVPLRHRRHPLRPAAGARRSGRPEHLDRGRRDDSQPVPRSGSPR